MCIIEKVTNKWHIGKKNIFVMFTGLVSRKHWSCSDEQVQIDNKDLCYDLDTDGVGPPGVNGEM